jgi:BirA family biotin operon repressor/biotin-[acetyl-CoA-carboxylase] ligase
VTLDSHILFALRGAGGGSVSGAELSQRLNISRAAVWARIDDLRSLGYDIEASPHRGYRLLSAPDVLHADDLLSQLDRSAIIGRDIRVFEQTTSTNDVVERLARDGVREGVVVFAESQTKGRGRLGRKWISPARKGIWFSVLLRFANRPQAATQLTVAAAVALAGAIKEETGLSPEIKWPNDLLIQGRKVAGILTELSAELDSIKYVILGIGVDVNLRPADFPAEFRAAATSLMIEAGHPIPRAPLACAILGELDRAYARIKRGEFQQVAAVWEGLCGTIGSLVAIKLGDRLVQGRAEALDSEGALLVRTEHGRLERIVGGDVTIVKPG